MMILLPMCSYGNLLCYEITLILDTIWRASGYTNSTGQVRMNEIYKIRKKLFYAYRATTIIKTTFLILFIRLWTPDILMYNSASQEFDSTYPVNIIVTDNGGCNHVPPGIFQSTCKVILTSYINDFGELQTIRYFNFGM